MPPMIAAVVVALAWPAVAASIERPVLSVPVLAPSAAPAAAPTTAASAALPEAPAVAPAAAATPARAATAAQVAVLADALKRGDWSDPIFFDGEASALAARQAHEQGIIS